MGLTYFKRYRMEIDLFAHEFPTLALPDGYSFHSWDADLLEFHADAKYRSFRAELDANVFPCLGESLGCLKLMSEIRAKQGFLPASTWLVSFMDAFNEMPDYCGTVQGIQDRHAFGSIQNLGIVPEHRGQGLGRALMHQALTGFRQAGLRRGFLEVTAQNEGAIRLYEQMGFSRVRTVYKAVEVASMAGH